MVARVFAYAHVHLALESALAPDARVEPLPAVAPDPLHEIERLVEHGAGDERTVAVGIGNSTVYLVVESGAAALDAGQVVADEVEFAGLGVLLPDLQLVELALTVPFGRATVVGGENIERAMQIDDAVRRIFRPIGRAERLPAVLDDFERVGVGHVSDDLVALAAHELKRTARIAALLKAVAEERLAVVHVAHEDARTVVRYSGDRIGGVEETPVGGVAAEVSHLQVNPRLQAGLGVDFRVDVLTAVRLDVVEERIRLFGDGIGAGTDADAQRGRRDGGPEKYFPLDFHLILFRAEDRRQRTAISPPSFVLVSDARQLF